MASIGELLSGTRCQVCGMALENSNYRKDEEGEGIYWANPKICEFTDVVLEFCGPLCSTAWWLERIKEKDQMKTLQKPGP